MRNTYEQQLALDCLRLACVPGADVDTIVRRAEAFYEFVSGEKAT